MQHFESIFRSSMDKVQLSRQTSVQVVKYWIKRAASSENIAPEFRSAYEKNCVNRSLMKETSIQHVFQYLDDLIDIASIKTGSVKDFQKVLRQCMDKAYPELNGKSDEMEYLRFTCPITNTFIFNDTLRLYNAFSWRQKYFHVGLFDLKEKLEPEMLMGLFTEFSRASSLCIAGKRFAFNLIMDLVDTAPSQSTANPSITSGKDENSQRIIEAFVTKFIGEFIGNAFRAAFMEPTKMCHRAIDKDSCLGEVAEQHAVNVYSALITAAVGIPVPIPYIDDEYGYGGCCSFLGCKNDRYVEGIKALLKKENFGKSYQVVKECRNVGITKNSVHTQKFIFDPTMSPREQGNAIASDLPEFKEERIVFAEYVSNFMDCFQVDFFVEKVLNRLNQGRPKEVQHMFTVFKRGRPDIEEDDYRFWIWDVLEGTMDTSRAVEFLQFLQIIRNDLQTDENGSYTKEPLKRIVSAPC